MSLPGSLTIRPAKPADSKQLYLWDEKPHVRQATSNSGTVSFDLKWEEELVERNDGTELFIAEVDGCPIGAMQVIDPERERTHYWGTVDPNQRAIDIWIGEEEFIGQGFGGRMMNFAINHCFAEPAVISILIDPLSNNVRSHKFYERLGFRFVERRQFDEDSDCFVFRLTREEWNDRNQDI